MYRWHAFSYEWFDTKTRFARGKSQLFIHELLREPLIASLSQRGLGTRIEVPTLSVKGGKVPPFYSTSLAPVKRF